MPVSGTPAHRFVKYHGRHWEWLTLAGWSTVWVDRHNIAEMTNEGRS